MINSAKNMDRVGNAIYSILSADLTLNTLVSNRIYPVIATQRESYPLLTYSIITNNPSDTKTGASTVDQYRVQFDSYAEDYDTAHDIMIRLREVIDRYPHLSISGIALDGISYISQNDGYEDEGQLFRVSADYYVRVKRLPIDPDPIPDPHYPVHECYELNTIHMLLPEGDTFIDIGFLGDAGHLVFANNIGPLINGADYTLGLNTLTLADAPFPNEVRIDIVRNKIRVRNYTQPANQATQFIGGILMFPVMVFVDNELQVQGVDYNIVGHEIEWINVSGTDFDFKIIANACTL